MMSWTRVLSITGILLLAFFFAPAIPTSVFFSLTASTHDFDDVPKGVGLSRDDVDEIVDLISNNRLYGNDSRYPPRLSLKQYVFDFENIGFQGIGHIPLGFTKECPDCTAAAFFGVTRDTFDVTSTMCFLAKRGEQWQIVEVRDGLTGSLLDDG